MENKCYEMRVGAVGNKNLVMVDELVLTIIQTDQTKLNNRKLVISSLSDDCHIRALDDGSFLDKTADNSDAKDIGTDLSVPQSTIYRYNTKTFYPSKGNFRIGISNKSQLCYLNISSPGSVSNNSVFSIDILKYCSNLSSLYCAGDNNVTGDISSLSGLTNLTTLVLGSGVTGDISSLSGLTNLTTLRLDSGVTATQEQIKMFTDRGCKVTIGNDVYPSTKV